MGNEYKAVVAGSAYRLARTWDRSTPVGPYNRMGGGGGSVGRPGVGRADRPVEGFTPKARRQMRWRWNASDWSACGERLAMITLTYPKQWRQVCPDGETLKRRHLQAFKLRWTREFRSPPVGMWVMEFQPRLDSPPEEQFAPHLHLYVGIPERAVLGEDPYDGRLVWDWARQAWWEIVGSGDHRHRYWGVHVRKCFFTGEAAQKYVYKLGEYLWRESGKAQQKHVPDDFPNVGRFWAPWGLPESETYIPLTEEEFLWMRRPSIKLRDKKAGRKVQRPRGRDGLAVFGVPALDVVTKLKQGAEREVGDRLPRGEDDAPWGLAMKRPAVFGIDRDDDPDPNEYDGERQYEEWLVAEEAREAQIDEMIERHLLERERVEFGLDPKTGEPVGAATRRRPPGRGGRRPAAG